MKVHITPASVMYFEMAPNPGIQVVVVTGRTTNITAGIQVHLPFAADANFILDTISIGCDRPCVGYPGHPGVCLPPLTPPLPPPEEEVIAAPVASTRKKVTKARKAKKAMKTSKAVGRPRTRGMAQPRLATPDVAPPEVLDIEVLDTAREEGEVLVDTSALDLSTPSTSGIFDLTINLFDPELKDDISYAHFDSDTESFTM